MALEFSKTSDQQLEDVAALLAHSFHASSDAPFLNRSFLHWKYYAPGPSLDGSRSYALTDKGRLLAHAAVWPITLRTQSGLRSGIGFGDWAAVEEQRGIGLLLLKKLTALAPFILVIGGAEITRQILPRVGFTPWASLPVYAKVLRPVSQVTKRPATLGWKEPARLARNLGWSWAASASPGTWTAEYGAPDDQTLTAAYQRTGSVHGRDLLAFLEQCPTVKIRPLRLSKAGVSLGYAVLSFVLGQARLAEIRIATDGDSDWQQAIAATLRLLARHKEASEVIAIASTPQLERAFTANGFRVRDRRPLVIYDSEKRIAGEPVPQLGMLEDDAVYLQTPEFPFLT